MKKQKQPKDDAARTDTAGQARGGRLPADLNANRLKPLRDSRISSPPDSTDFLPVDKIRK